MDLPFTQALLKYFFKSGIFSDDQKQVVISEEPRRLLEALYPSRSREISGQVFQSLTFIFFTRRGDMTSLFLDHLPAELCDYICHILLVSDEPVSIRSIPDRTAILRTCSQIQDEADGIFDQNAVRVTYGMGDGNLAA